MIHRKAFLAFCFGAPFGLSSAATGPLEINQATEAQLDSVLGIGPGLSRRILEARGQRPFADWSDLIERVRGIGPRSARKLSREGLRVNGLSYETPATRPAPQAPPQVD
ncbi:MAG: helix-hairpin-helix domain-containing protein [Curvibacter sp.]|nr:helix-hairpin-helix domain-containing protein [Curvibacter sp.]